MKQNLGDFIATLRKEKGMTQRELAELLNVSDKTVSHWERKESSPDISVLPLIADIFGITVDELLRGEKREMPLIEPVLSTESQPKKIDRSFHKFKIQNIISASLSLLSVILGIAVKGLLTHVIFSQAANTFAAYVTLCGVFVSLVCTIIFNVIFKNKLNGAEPAHEYRFKANRISSLNFYFALISFSIILSFAGRHGFLYITIALVISVIAELLLTSKGPLNTENLFKNDKQEQLYCLRRICALTCVALIILGGVFHFFVSEVYRPTVADVVFSSAEEFKEYMETPKERPENAYLIDGKITVTEPPTAPPSEEQNNSTYIYGYTETVYGLGGEEIVTFNRFNKEVYRFSYDDKTETFHVTTFDSEIRAKNIRTFCDETADMLMPFYCLAIIGITLIFYKKKAKLYAE